MKLSTALAYSLHPPARKRWQAQAAESILRNSLPRGYEQKSSREIMRHWAKRFRMARAAGLPAETMLYLFRACAWRQADLQGTEFNHGLHG